jgi:hypothetical protein
VSQRLAAADASGVQRLQGLETALQAQVQGVTQLATIIAALDTRLKVVETQATPCLEALLPFGAVAPIQTSAGYGASEPRSNSSVQEQARREPPARGIESSPATSSSGPPRIENPLGEPERSRTPWWRREEGVEANYPPWRRRTETAEPDRASDGGQSRMTARVNALGLGQGGALEPLALEALRKVSVFRFSGNRRDFQEWKRKWEEYYGLLQATQGEIPSRLLFEFLKGWLDDATQVELTNRMQENPDLGYEEFYTELCRMFGAESSASKRGAWREVALSCPGGRLTLAEWRGYQARLRRALYGIDHPHEEEMREHILKQLPDGLRNAVLREEVKARRNQHWVCVHCPEGVTPEDVLVELQTREVIPLHLPTHAIQWRGRRLMVDLGSPANRDWALRFDGEWLEQGAGRVQVSRWETNFSTERIRQVIEEKVEEDEAIQEYRQADSRSLGHGRSAWEGGTPPWNRRVWQVEEGDQWVVSPVAQEGEPKGRGVNSKGKGKGWRKGSTPTGRGGGAIRNRPPDDECLVCKSAGRDYVHIYWECPHWQAARGRSPERRGTSTQRGLQGKGRSPSPQSAGPVCYACRSRGKPFDHIHWECELWKATIPQRGLAPDGQTAASSSGSGAEVRTPST